MKKRNNRRVLQLVAVACIALGVALIVYNRFMQIAVVPFAKATRALGTNELPNEQKPTVQEVAKHANEKKEQPRKLVISKLGIAARIIPLQVDKKGVIQSPANIFDVGWLASTATQQQKQGFMVMDGHVQGQTNQGVFYGLTNLKTGDGIVVEDGGGVTTSFTVSQIKIIDYNEDPKTTLLAEPVQDVFELRLVTCTGEYLQQQKTYSKRVVVIAKRQ